MDQHERILVAINSQSPLSHLNVFNRLQVGPYEFRSIEQIKWFVFMVQSEKSGEAHQVRTQHVHNRNPGNITTWAERNNCLPDSRCIIEMKAIVKDILIDQMNQDDSEFRAEFMDLLVDLDGKKPKFVACSATQELVMSCGLRANKIESRDFQPGFNIYGEILDEIYDSISRGQVLEPRWGVNQLTVAQIPGFRLNWPHPMTLQVIADSFARIINHIECGQVVSISRARFSDLMTASRDLRLIDFGIIILQCGNNVANKSDFIRQVELQVMKEFVEHIASLPNAPIVLISGALPVPGAKNVTQFNQNMEDILEHLPVRFINWSKNNAFEVNGHFNDIFVKVDDPAWNDGFHLGPTGIWVLWKEWCKAVPFLRCVKYSLTPTPYCRRPRPSKRTYDVAFRH